MRTHCSGLSLLFLLLVSGCPRTDTTAPKDVPQTAGAAAAAAKSTAAFAAPVRRELSVDKLSGFSSLARHPDGSLWSAPERGGKLVRLKIDEPGAGLIGQPLSVEGLPDDWDIESLAWLDAKRIALGTETQEDDRTSDAILIAEVSDTAARVVERIILPYDLWAMTARENKGVEGLCAVDGQMLAVVESVKKCGRARCAPLGRYDLKSKRWTAFTVKLTSKQGKLSAIACRRDGKGKGIEAFAIERHFNVSHLLRLQVPMKGEGAALTAEVIADLGTLVQGIPNMEGIDLGVDGRLEIIVDNNYGGVWGPTEVILLTPTP